MTEFSASISKIKRLRVGPTGPRRLLYHPRRLEGVVSTFRECFEVTLSLGNSFWVTLFWETLFEYTLLGRLFLGKSFEVTLLGKSFG